MRLNRFKSRKFSFCYFWAHKTRKITLFLLFSFAFLWFLSLHLGLYVNTSSSLEKGIYLRSDLVDFFNFKNSKQTKYKKGDLVAFCPPNLPVFNEAKKRRYIGISSCKGNLGIMMKEITATQNDLITINKNGVIINGKLRQNSKPLAFDNQAQKMPQIYLKNYKLKEKEVLLMGKTSNSFDSRYFGAIKESQIKHRIKLVWKF